MLTLEQLENDGFKVDPPLFFCYIAEDAVSKQAIGHILTSFRYSSYDGKQLHIEDMYVKEEHRNKGIGRRLFHQAALLAERENSNAMAWECTSWNETAIKFYKSVGALNETEIRQWEVYSLEGQDFHKFLQDMSSE